MAKTKDRCQKLCQMYCFLLHMIIAIDIVTTKSPEKQTPDALFKYIEESIKWGIWNIWSMVHIVGVEFLLLLCLFQARRDRMNLASRAAQIRSISIWNTWCMCQTVILAYGLIQCYHLGGLAALIMKMVAVAVKDVYCIFYILYARDLTEEREEERQRRANAER